MRRKQKNQNYFFKLILCRSIDFVNQSFNPRSAVTIFLVSVLSGFYLPSLAQNTVPDTLNQGNPIIVSGVVTDGKGAPAAGVSITLKGALTATSTNAEGKYTIKVPRNGILVFTSVSYTAREAKVNSQTVINVQLTENAAALDDVVVVGYGRQKRENLIGSVGQVTARQLENRPVAQLSRLSKLC